MLEKPKSVEVGQRWGFTNGEWIVHTVDENFAWWREPGQSTSGKDGPGMWFKDILGTSYTFLGWAPGYGPTAPSLESRTTRRGSAMGDTDAKFYWLIEAPGPCYLKASGNFFYWNSSHDDAIKFVSERQATDVMHALARLQPDLFKWPGPQAPKPVEHGWVPPLNPEPSHD